MKFLSNIEVVYIVTHVHILSSFIKKMIINFFTAIFLWRIDLVYGDATAANDDCRFAFENSCPDSVVGGVYFDEVFGDTKEVIIKNQAVIIRQNTTVNRIRIDKCGLLTVQGTRKLISAMLVY